MSTTLDDFFALKSEQEKKALLDAQRVLEPESYLNMKFSVEEAQRLRSKRLPKAKTFDEQIAEYRQKTIDDLKKKTVSSLQTRIQKFNEEVSKVTHQSNYLEKYNFQKMKEWHENYIEQNGMDFLESLIEKSAQNRISQMDLMRATFNPTLFYEILTKCYPSVMDVEFNPSGYPFMIDFMENVPWPTPKEADQAVKLYLGWGTDEWADGAMEFLIDVHTKNVTPTSQFNYYFCPQTGKYIGQVLGETTYGLQTLNPSYSLQSEQEMLSIGVGRRVWYWQTGVWNTSACKFKSYDLAGYYWSARPQPGYVYIHKIGYINPRFFTTANLMHTYSIYGWGEELRRRAEKEAKKSRGFFGNLVKDIGKIVGNVWREVSPIHLYNQALKNVPFYDHAYSDLNNLTGGFMDQLERVNDLPGRALRGEPITAQDWMEALDVGLKIAAIAATGGSASTLIGVISSQLQRGALGKTEFGRLLLTTGEILAASNIANSSLQKAASKVGEREAMKLAKRELEKRTDLEETILGNIALNASLSAGQSAYHSEDYTGAIINSVKAGVITGIAKDNPILAAISGAAISLYDNPELSSDIDITSPEGAFDSFDWDNVGGEILDYVKNMDSEKIKRLIGLGILTATGRIDSKDLMNYFAKDLSLQYAESFKTNTQVTYNLNQDAQTVSALQGIQAAKNEINLLTDVVHGHVPSPSELTMIADSNVAGYLSDKITSVIPEEFRNYAYKEAFKIGLPDIDLSLDLGIDIPDWAKIGKVEVPEWAKIDGHEDWVKDLQKGVEDFKNGVISQLTWQNMVSMYLHSLWPPNMPLRPVGDGSGVRHYIDTSGFLSVREPLDLRYLHPMLSKGLIERKISEEELNYQKARDLELEKAKVELAKLGIT